MAIKREDKMEHMKALLETKIKDCVRKYTKLCNLVYSNIWFDKEKGEWHYEGGSQRIVHAVEDREKCALEIAKLLVWLRRYVCAYEIIDEKRNTTLRCYEFESTKRYLNPMCGEKFLYRKYIVEFEIVYMLEKNKTRSISREHIELELVNERLIRKEIGFK